MDHWNKGGLSREEFLRMRENALRQLQELAKKQQAFANVDKAPAQNSNVMKNSSEKVLSARPEEKPQQTAPEKMQDAAVARPKEADLQTPPILPDRPDRLDAGDFLHGSPKPVWQNERQPLQEPPEIPQRPIAMPVERETEERLLEFTPAIPSHLPPEGYLHPPLPSEPEADLLQSLSNISRTIENIGFSSESGFQNGPAAAPANAGQSREDVFFPNLPESNVPQADFLTDIQEEQVLPAFAPDDLFPLPEQPAKEEAAPPRETLCLSVSELQPVMPAPSHPVPPAPPAPPLDSDPRQPRSPKPDSPPSRSPYHPDGFIPDRPGRVPVFHPDAVAAKEERYIPPAPPQKPPFRRRSLWGGENPKKK